MRKSLGRISHDAGACCLFVVVVHYVARVGDAAVEKTLVEGVLAVDVAQVAAHLLDAHAAVAQADEVADPADVALVEDAAVRPVACHVRYESLLAVVLERLVGGAGEFAGLLHGVGSRGYGWLVVQRERGGILGRAEPDALARLPEIQTHAQHSF